MLCIGQLIKPFYLINLYGFMSRIIVLANSINHLYIVERNISAQAKLVILNGVPFMQYQGQTDYDHKGPSPKSGVLLCNLGTPDAPQTPELRRYLKQFLSDPRVVEIPRLLWWLILNLVILRIRPSRSAKLYRSVWSEETKENYLRTVNSFWETITSFFLKINSKNILSKYKLIVGICVLS